MHPRIVATPFVLVCFVVACSASSSGGGGSGAQSGTGGVSSGGSGTGGGLAQGGDWASSGGTPGGGGAAGVASTSGGAAGASGQGSGGTTPSSGACTNSSDQAALNAINVAEVVGNCAQQNLGAEPGTHDCIAQATGLSAGCVDCFDGEVQCTTANCLSQCMFDSNGPDCINCRAQFCDPAFATCSGLTP